METRDYVLVLSFLGFLSFLAFLAFTRNSNTATTQMPVSYVQTRFKISKEDLRRQGVDVD